MQSLWNDEEAALFPGLLGQRVYTSRLLGRDKTLVMHGGGNTSVKVETPTLFGDAEQILYVKGSGWDLETIEAEGFSPCRMERLLQLGELDTLSDAQMANELRQSMTRASAPAPSVEAILHALLPYTYVDHTHADAIIAITNTRNGRARIEELYGERVVIIPYVMPGFLLARLVAQEFPKQATDRVAGMVLMNHGLFTFGETARESYERMIALVDEAEDYLKQHNAWAVTYPAVGEPEPPAPAELAAFRREVSDAAGRPMIVAVHQDAQSLGFAHHDDLEALATQGPLTPDHVIRTKRLPMIGRDVAAYQQAYCAYFEANSARAAQPLTMLDTAPRVALDQAWGMVTIGKTANDAAIVEDIYRHTMNVILRATALGGYEALPAEDIFDVEYWDLEQAKLKAAGSPLPFTGEIALVTGAASGIGKGCVDALRAGGAAVAGVDIDPAVETLLAGPNWLGVAGDVADESTIRAAIARTAQQFGGLDMLVLNAGIFPPGTPIRNLDSGTWSKVMQVNLDANLAFLREAYPLLKQAPNGGRVVIVGSKNVPAPGPGAAAYSASKAALTQLARVAALEWGGDGIRVNVVHPNAVFDTALWTEEVLANRAKHYGMTVEQYKTNNVLKVEVTSRAVGNLVASLCGPTFAFTTGAQIPIDGGNERVI